MGKIIYISGGARSGKSTFAEKYLEELRSHEEKIYIATANVYDREMEIRVEKHRKQRGYGWRTIENYKNLSQLLKEISDEKKIILLDCITNLVTNFMLEIDESQWVSITKEKMHERESIIKSELENLLKTIKSNGDILIIVSNEVGMGIVPENPLARHFRDIAGRVNQYLAKESDEVYVVISGIELKLK